MTKALSYYFPNFEPVSCSTSSSVSSWPAHWFLRRQVKCSGIPIFYFPQFAAIHTVKNFNVVNETEVDAFLEIPCFLYDPMNVGNLISDSFAFSKPNLYIWKVLVYVLLKPNLKDFKHKLTSMWNKYNCAVVWTFFGIALLWGWNENWFFQYCDHCWVFQICWHTGCSTLMASSFRIWNGLAGIPSPSLLLFTVMLPKAFLTSYSSMSGSRWVTTSLWLLMSLRPFVYSSSVYSCHCFLISSAYVRYPYHFCPLLCPSLCGMFPWYLQFSWWDSYSSTLSTRSNPLNLLVTSTV